MPRAFVAFAAAAIAGSVSPAAFGVTDALVPAAAGVPALAVSVDIPGKVLRYQTCGAGPCAVTSASATVPISVGDRLVDPKTVAVETLSIGGGRRVVHVKVPLAADGEAGGVAWEALVAAGSPPLFAGLTGWSRGEPGERSGTAIQLLPTDGRTVVVLGDIREDLRICGDDISLLEPRGLDPATLVFRGASLQRLSVARRDAATPVVASPRHGPAEPALAPLLLASDASGGRSAALTDGDPATAWSETRPGRGQGEFVLMRAPFDVPIVRFTITIAPTVPIVDAAAPETFYLATGAGTYLVTMPEDAMAHPGEAYDIPLPEAVKTSCVALVLGDAFAQGRPRPVVTVAELAAYSAFDHAGANLGEVASALGGGGARAEAAAAVLERAGAQGLVAVRGVYRSLDSAGRGLALNIAASAPSCDASAAMLIDALGDADSVVHNKARAKLEEPTCGRESVPALATALRATGSRVEVARLLALMAREKAVPALLDVLGDGSPEVRQAVRAALSYAARQAAPSDLTSWMTSAAGRPVEAGLDLLRALTSRLGDAQEAANATVASLLSRESSARVRYLLVDPVAALARSGDEHSKARLAGLVVNDPDPPIRAHAAEQVALASGAADVMMRGLHDESPRVREAIVRAVGESRLAPATATVATLLEHDPWTFVRVAAAEALGSLPTTPPSNRALGAALEQLSPRVREQATYALGARGAIEYRDAIRERLSSTKEDPAVIAASARVLGALCDTRAVDALTKMAVRGGTSLDAAEVSLGLNATEALGRIHPTDLVSRLGPLHAKGVRPDARAAAARAAAQPVTCAVSK